MKIIKQSHKIIALPENSLEIIEQIARTCDKSEDKPNPGSTQRVFRSLVDRGHRSLIEFADITVRFTTSRSVAHELVRHRLCSFARESVRYVSPGGREMAFIRPVWWGENPVADNLWEHSMFSAKQMYKLLLDQGWRPEQAREILPNSFRADIDVRANLREWRHIFQLRCSKAANPQIRALMLPLLKELAEKIPVAFDDLEDEFGRNPTL